MSRLHSTRLLKLADREFRELTGKPAVPEASRRFRPVKIHPEKYDSAWDRKRGAAVGLTAITTVKPMSAYHARALHLAYELQGQLGGLLTELMCRGQFSPGCAGGIAWDRTDEVVRMLEPAEEPSEEPPAQEGTRPPERGKVIEFRRARSPEGSRP